MEAEKKKTKIIIMATKDRTYRSRIHLFWVDDVLKTAQSRITFSSISLSILFSMPKELTHSTILKALAQ